MAINIMDLKEFPIYCWEAHYASALVSYIGAVIFKLFGIGFVQIRSGMLIFSILAIIFMERIYEKLFGRMNAFLCVLFYIFCPYVILHHTMGAYGGYGELVFGMALVIYSSWRINEHVGREGFGRVLFFSGFAAGFFLQIIFLIIPVIIAFIFTSLYRRFEDIRWKGISVFTAGFIIGLSPLIVYNFLFPLKTFLRAGGRSLGVGRNAMIKPTAEIVLCAIQQKLAYLKWWVLHLPYNLSTFLYPFQKPSPISNMVGIFLIASLLLFIIVALRDKRNDIPRFYFRQFAFSVVLLFFFHWGVGLNHDRHFMPLLLVWPVILFYFKDIILKGRGLVLSLIPLFIIANVMGWNSEFRKSVFDPYPAAKFLSSNHLMNFYGSYDTTYSIMFASGGVLNGAPYLIPDGIVLRDRKIDITEKVRSSPEPAFIFADYEHNLEKIFIRYLADSHVEYFQNNVGNATIFYRLNKKVNPYVKKEWETGFEITE
ncbi:MAG: glycosyltransferase family 39 protein [Thermodesulfobacteriota bacterium]